MRSWLVQVSTAAGSASVRRSSPRPSAAVTLTGHDVGAGEGPEVERVQPVAQGPLAQQYAPVQRLPAAAAAAAAARARRLLEAARGGGARVCVWVSAIAMLSGRPALRPERRPLPSPTKQAAAPS